MIAEYLTLVRPLEVFLSTKFNCNGKDDLKEFLWADYRKGRWNGEFLTCILPMNTWYSWPLIWRPNAISYKKMRKYHLLMGRTPCIHMYFP